MKQLTKDSPVSKFVNIPFFQYLNGQIAKQKPAGKGNYMAALSSPNHNKNAKITSKLSDIMPISDLPLQDIIPAENENMDIDGALHNSLLSAPQRPDLR